MALYIGLPKFHGPQQEFTRAMFCPEVEQERARLERILGSARAELNEMRKFIVIQRERHEKDKRFDVYWMQMRITHDMLEVLMRDPDMFYDHLVHYIMDQLTGLMRPKHKARR